jgi:hypothetical protein
MSDTCWLARATRVNQLLLVLLRVCTTGIPTTGSAFMVSLNRLSDTCWLARATRVNQLLLVLLRVFYGNPNDWERFYGVSNPTDTSRIIPSPFTRITMNFRVVNSQFPGGRDCQMKFHPNISTCLSRIFTHKRPSSCSDIQLYHRSCG